MHPTKNRIKYAALPLGAILIAGASAQTAAPAPESQQATEEEIIVLSPFEVTASETSGYVATTTMAGSRINTELRDVGSAISVVTSEFLKDTGATDNATLLQYTTNTEVGSVQGNFTRASAGATQDEGPTFTNPNTNTRVRGLDAADNTRNFFLTQIPWDAYNVDRVDMQRGPNSILFGMGSPAGIIDTTTKTAQFRNFGEFEFRYGSEGSNRVTFDYNHQLLEDELAMRVAAVRNDTQYKQDPAYSLDRRIFATTRWEPKFLKKAGSRTVVKASFEAGKVRSNNPRAITPGDYITPWFTAMNKRVFDPTKVQDNNPHTQLDVDGNPVLDGDGNPVTYFPNGYGQAIPTKSNGTANAEYEPWLGNFAQSFGGPLAFFTSGSATTPSRIVMSEWQDDYGLNSAGAIDGSVGGHTYSRRVSVDEYYRYASDVGLPYSGSGVYKSVTLSDASVFDFYNQLLDGPNKKEWQDFRNFNASLSQTFLDQRVGFDLAYDYQSYDSGRYSFLDGNKAGIYIDINTHDLDGTPNPNVGRAFVSDAVQYGNSQSFSKRESGRATVFAMHDFNRNRDGAWWKKLLGKHVVTGLYSRDHSQTDARSFLRMGTDDTYSAAVHNSARDGVQKFTDNARQINRVVYLGDSLLGASSASGAYLPNPSEVQMPGADSTFYYFNSTWNSTVNPADPWRNTLFNNEMVTQSENPANYIGWTTMPLNVIDADASAADRDSLTWQAQQTRTLVASKAAVVQSYLWDGAIVGMWGVRNDHVKLWNLNASKFADDHVNLDPEVYALRTLTPNLEEDNTTTWSVVAHVNKFIPKMPFNLSFFYNESENFQPGAGRVDVYNRQLASPNGSTKDKGFVISTRDDRFSLKVNKYETKMQNAGASLDGNWFLGAVMGWGGNWADIFEYNLRGNTIDTAEPDGTYGRYTYGQAPGETPEQAAEREANAIAGFRALEAKIPAAYWTAWGLDPTIVSGGQGASNPSGFAAVQDYVSKGWEFEFTANPTRNWRISLNASKAEAVRKNIGGAALIEFVDIVNNALVNTDAGDLRIWWGGAGNDTLLKLWRQNFYTNFASQRIAEGTSTPEMRKWRFNLVTNYDFREGFLKGVNVGMGYRWQDKIAIGYPVMEVDGEVLFDIDNPFYGPTEGNFDFWIGYEKKLTSKIDWRIQLNIRNAFDGNDVIPLSVNPSATDPRGYTVAAWRIAPYRTWQITSTFKF